MEKRKVEITHFVPLGLDRIELKLLAKCPFPYNLKLQLTNLAISYEIKIFQPRKVLLFVKRFYFTFLVSFLTNVYLTCFNTKKT